MPLFNQSVVTLIHQSRYQIVSSVTRFKADKVLMVQWFRKITPRSRILRQTTVKAFQKRTGREVAKMFGCGTRMQVYKKLYY